MMRSMFAGVSGLKNHQIRMDVIGNNIANVNTTGYKSSRVTFQDTLAQTLSGATAPQRNRGGINPMQVGLGCGLASIDVLHTAGNLQTTGVNTDLALQGNGFFIVGDGTNNYYTRAGNFSMDTSGRLVYTNGLQLQGWIADPITGVINTNGRIEGIRLPINDTVDPHATATITLTGNLNSETPIAPADGCRFTRNVSIYDSLGNPHVLSVIFEKTGVNAWTCSVEDPAGTVLLSENITFTETGYLDTGGPTFAINYNPGTGAANVNATIDLSALKQQQADESSVGYEQDGYAMGYLNTFKIDSSGKIVGVFTNGQTKDIAQVAVATFSNPGGLEKAGQTMFQVSSNSGAPQINPSGVGGSGTITPGTLEMSNVDLSQEFTDMIVTQRGFQANSRIITTSDEMLQELVNLKR
ncbi:MAG TPA: flagellar hook protein FlgE [Firmicutes bacterium]|nr:flagellar hook protein FlgE [Bacillota bacterium]